MKIRRREAADRETSGSASDGCRSVLRGVCLTAISADDTQIEASFQAAIRIAKEQKAVSHEKRAQGNHEEYRRQSGRSFSVMLARFLEKKIFVQQKSVL